jgi:7-cyano-7-deazaguanine reductase
MSEGKDLIQLGSNKTDYKYGDPSHRILETFENKCPQRDYVIEFIFDEFTSLCPKTGQPDFATIEINYIPDQLCIESKSFKLYMFAYRSHGAFMETIVNQMLDDFVRVCQPRYMIVYGRFNARGGVNINVQAEYEKTSIDA